MRVENQVVMMFWRYKEGASTYHNAWNLGITFEWEFKFHLEHDGECLLLGVF